jgi:hypothetical protein
VHPGAIDMESLQHRCAGVGGVFHAPHNTALFLAAVGTLTALTELHLEGSDLHIATLFDEDDEEVRARPQVAGPPSAAATQAHAAQQARGLALLSTLTNLQKLVLQGTCCWRILSSGVATALLSLTSLTHLSICIHESDVFRSVRTPRCAHPAN